MQAPFKIQFPAPGNDVTNENKFRDLARYLVPSATTVLNKRGTATLIIQSTGGDDHWLELWSFTVQENEYVDLLVSEPFVFVSLMLKGSMHTASEQQQTIQLTEGTYNMHYLPVSTLRFLLKKGVTDILLLIMPMYYLRTMSKAHPGIAELVTRVAGRSTEAASLESYLFPKRLLVIIKRLVYTTVKSFSNSHELLQYMLEILSLYAGQYNSLTQGFAKTASTAEKTQYARRYILGHRGNLQYCTINKIATQFDLTPKTLNRNFKKLTGMPVSVFARNERLHYAKQLLENEKLTEEEVALKTGYSETSNFIRAFKTRYGYPPQHH